MAQFDHELVVRPEHERFGERVDGHVRLGLVEADGGPAVTRVVIEGVLHVAIATMLLLVGHDVGDGVGHEDILDLIIAARAHLKFKVGKLELAVFPAGESALGMRGVGQDFEAQAGDALEAIMADDPVFVLVRVWS